MDANELDENLGEDYCLVRPQDVAAPVFGWAAMKWTGLPPAATF